MLSQESGTLLKLKRGRQGDKSPLTGTKISTAFCELERCSKSSRHNKGDEMTQDQVWEKQSLLRPKLCGSELAFAHKFSKKIYFYFTISMRGSHKGAYFRKRGGQAHVVYDGTQRLFWV